MNKKGLIWGNVVYAIIAVIVLITLVWIFRKQINEILKSLFSIINTTTTGAEEAGNDINKIIGK